SALLLPEDHPVDVPQLGLVRVDDVVRRLEVGLDRPAELDQPRQLARLDRLLERRVERAAERDVDLAARRPRPWTNAGTLRKRTDRTRPPSRRATVGSRPDGTSTTTSGPSTSPLSIAQVTSAIVPWPQAVE